MGGVGSIIEGLHGNKDGVSEYARRLETDLIAAEARIRELEAELKELKDLEAREAETPDLTSD